MGYWDIVFYNFIGLIRVFFLLGATISAIICANWCFSLDDASKDKKRVMRNITLWGSLVLILPIVMCFIPF